MLNYVIDTSSLINLQQHYPMAAFLALWDRIASLAKDGMMAAPVQVLRELEPKDDDLLEWAKKNRHMFKKIDGDAAQLAGRLANEHGSMRNEYSSTEKADPYVIAMAYHRTHGTVDGSWDIVTEEGTSKGNMIPKIAKSHGLAHCSLVDVILREGWSFG